MKANVKKRKITSKKREDKGIKKQYLKTRPDCRVTFRLPKEAAQAARHVSVVGDFNNWSITETPMKKLKNGDFKATITLRCDREYKFRYLIDADRWENDWYADKYVPNCYGSDDSVVVICESLG
jgi:1,4-alpha-glucan branching enzyme